MSLAYINKKLRRQSKQLEQTTAGPSVETSTPTPAPAAPIQASDSTPAPAPTTSSTTAAQQPVPNPEPAAITSPGEETATSPILDEEDEKFLQRLAAIAGEPDGPAPPLPTRPDASAEDRDKQAGKSAQEAIMDGANTVPLPTSPPEVTAESADKGKAKDTGLLARRKSVMSYFSKFKKTGGDKEKDSKGKEKVTAKDRERAADDLHAAAEAAKTTEAEVAKENEDLTKILDQLNLSAVNNRVFSFSKESEVLVQKFTLVLKDIVNGAPTAYNDLEKLLTDSEGQLKKMYGGLPPFLQNLVKSLPTKLTAALGPELLAAAAEKPGFDAQAASGSKPRRAAIPSLKSLVTAQGAVATMLKSILNFLKLRFPGLLAGTNVLLSIAVFLLLFVFWYCHKRGRETRLEKERSEGGAVSGSSASSFVDDGDSLLRESTTADAERAQPPLIIADNQEVSSNTTASNSAPLTAEDLPSVAHLPEPKTVPLPETPAKEEPLAVPANK